MVFAWFVGRHGHGVKRSDGDTVHIMFLRTLTERHSFEIEIEGHFLLHSFPFRSGILDQHDYNPRGIEDQDGHDIHDSPVIRARHVRLRVSPGTVVNDIPVLDGYLDVVASIHKAARVI